MHLREYLHLLVPSLSHQLLWKAALSSLPEIPPTLLSACGEKKSWPWPFAKDLRQPIQWLFNILVSNGKSILQPISPYLARTKLSSSRYTEPAGFFSAFGFHVKVLLKWKIHHAVSPWFLICPVHHCTLASRMAHGYPGLHYINKALKK